jgi:flavin-dependent dehydrogenase
VLCGDAAGFFDGITGEGMSAALIGGRLCAAAIDTYLATDSYAPFRAYEAARRGLVQNSTRIARLALLLGRDARVADLAIRNLSRQPATFARLVAVTSREAGLTSLRPRDVMAMLTGR